LTPPGFHSIFEYGKDRENWVVMLAFPAIQFDEAAHQLCWHHNGNALPLPRYVPLKEAELLEMRQTFDTLSRLYYSSLPQNQLAAELLVLQILQNFLRLEQQEDDHVERLRKRLEEDVLWENTITEHCVALGCCRDQLRQEFFERYKIAPGEYRIQMRLRKIRHLLAYSELTLKEIAYEVGMKNLSHLSRFVKERCGKTPSELSREYRNKS
jgi:AraC-like DNA-binding protein